MSFEVKALLGIVSFLLTTTFIYEIGGGKATTYFLFLVLIGTLITHEKNITSLAN